MLVARAALLAGDVDRAAADARGEATARFEAQGRAGWWAAAASLRVEAHHRAGAADESDAAAIDTVIAATEDGRARPPPPPTPASSPPSWRAGARRRGRRRTPPRRRRRTGSGWPPVVAATSSQPSSWPRAGRPEDALRRCAATADEFASLTSVLGGTELRAHVAMHVAAVVDLGVALSPCAAATPSWRSPGRSASEPRRWRRRRSARRRRPSWRTISTVCAPPLIEFDVKLRDGVERPGSRPSAAPSCRTASAGGPVRRPASADRRSPPRACPRPSAETSPRGSRSSRSRASSPPCGWSTAGIHRVGSARSPRPGRRRHADGARSRCT